MRFLKACNQLARVHQSTFGCLPWPVRAVPTLRLSDTQRQTPFPHPGWFGSQPRSRTSSADRSLNLRSIQKNKTHHLWPRILAIQEYTIFNLSRTLVVRSSAYFSSSAIGSTDANQYGKSAGSWGGSP